jgi:hypothetical protein
MAKNTIPTRPTPPKAHPAPDRIIDPEKLLDDATKASLRAKAQAKVKARDIADAEEAYLKAEMERLDKEAHPEIVEEMREIRVSLALYADRVVLDGRAYFADETYVVSKRVYDVLKECERNSFRHDEEVHSGNADDHFYRKSRQYSASMRTGVATSGLTGAPVRF